MPVGTDEMMLLVDGIIPVDPAPELRSRAQAFIASRQWSTPQIFVGDQGEPEFSDKQTTRWSISFALGLDHVPRAGGDDRWFGDVAALIEFVRPIALETRSEFMVEFRLRSRLWYSETITTIDENDAKNPPDLASIRQMLDSHINAWGRRSWWRRLLG
jgi:hypothetical protein